MSGFGRGAVAAIAADGEGGAEIDGTVRGFGMRADDRAVLLEQAA